MNTTPVDVAKLFDVPMIEQTKHYSVLAFPNFPMMAFSAIIEPLRAANWISEQEHYSWSVVGLSKNPIVASNGYSIVPDYCVEDMPRTDRLVLVSGGDAERLDSKSALRWIRSAMRQGSQIGAVADAAYFLAKSGLLDGYRCTLHWTSQPAFMESFPDIQLERALYVLDRNRFTALGGVGCLDMMIAMIERDTDLNLSLAVADWFVHSPLRSNADRKEMSLFSRTGIRDPLVLACVARMEADMEERLTIMQVSAMMGVSTDTLERAFRAEFGESPGKYWKKLRLRKARDLLIHSRLSVRDVALAVGYTSPTSFARAFGAVFGLAPLDIRRQNRLL